MARKWPGDDSLGEGLAGPHVAIDAQRPRSLTGGGDELVPSERRHNPRPTKAWRIEKTIEALMAKPLQPRGDPSLRGAQLYRRRRGRHAVGGQEGHPYPTKAQASARRPRRTLSSRFRTPREMVRARTCRSTRTLNQN